MQLQDRALLQERVRTLVLRHALEAALSRIVDLTDRGAEDELLALERLILRQMSGVPDRAPTQKLAVLGAVEDAVVVVRGAFDKAHGRTAPTTPPAKLALVA